MALRYITLSELVNAIPEVVQGSTTDDVANSETRVDAIATQLAESAEEEVESYLSVRYTIPYEASDDTVPNSIKRAIFTITKYNMYARRDAIDAGIQTQYDNIVSWLRRVVSGDANIPLLDASGNVESQGGVTLDVSDLDLGDYTGGFA